MIWGGYCVLKGFHLLPITNQTATVVSFFRWEAFFEQIFIFLPMGSRSVWLLRHFRKLDTFCEMYSFAEAQETMHHSGGLPLPRSGAKNCRLHS